MNRDTLINLNPDKHNQALIYYPFMVNLDTFYESCNSADGPSGRIYVTNKKEVVNLNFFNMITGINKSKTLQKLILCKCKCRFDGRKCN